MSNSVQPARALANRDGREVVDVKFCVDNPTGVSPERLRAEYKKMKGALDNKDFVELPLPRA